MLVEEYIEIIKPEVIEMFKDDSSGHDISHLERTMNLALNIQEFEGGDRIVIGIAAFLHDIHRLMQNQLGYFVSPKDSLGKVEEIINKLDLTEEQKQKILHSIEYHEEYNWNNPNNKEQDINTLILQDADNLDAIGAIGIGRTFCYGGAHKVLMYDSNYSLEQDENYAEEKGDDPSTIHHFYHKLFKLGENMNTNRAKEIAKERTEFMKNFVDEFMKEWRGEK